MTQTQIMITLADFFKELDQHDHRVPLELLEDRIKRVQIDPVEIEPFIKFAADTYRRNLLRAGPAYHALVLCWKNGQRSPIHDHFGSSCAVRVLRGTCTETIFQRTSAGHIFPTETHKLPTGHCCGSQDSDIHQISNIEPDGSELVTLHIYSPPLLLMGKYSLTHAGRTEFEEAVICLAKARGFKPASKSRTLPTPARADTCACIAGLVCRSVRDAARN